VNRESSCRPAVMPGLRTRIRRTPRATVRRARAAPYVRPVRAECAVISRSRRPRPHFELAVSESPAACPWRSHRRLSPRCCGTGRAHARRRCHYVRARSHRARRGVVIVPRSEPSCTTRDDAPRVRIRRAPNDRPSHVPAYFRAAQRSAPFARAHAPRPCAQSSPHISSVCIEDEY